MYYLIMYIVIMAFLILFTIRTSYITRKSEKHKDIKKLNEDIILNPVIRKLKFHKEFNSKKAIFDADGFDVMIEIIKENEDYYFDLVDWYKKEEEKYSDYCYRFEEIINKDYNIDNEELKKNLFFSKKFYIKYENFLCKQLLKKCNNKVDIKVSMSYTSPQGRSSYGGETDVAFSTLVEAVETIKQHKEYLKSNKYQRSLMSSSLRYDVIKRDGFKCRICGASVDDGVKLEVDHIIPVSKGGKTELKNLQTLCERCNRGKSNK